MVLVLVIVLIWGQDSENVFPARKTLQSMTKTMGIQVIDIIGSDLWIIKAQNLRAFV